VGVAQSTTATKEETWDEEEIWSSVVKGGQMVEEQRRNRSIRSLSLVA
jgi:hypothetical protein